MEDVRAAMEFARPDSGSGYGRADGYGDGDGSGYGCGCGSGRGSGRGNGSGSGDGYGGGRGNGSGSGDGYGNGYGCGYGSGMKSINCLPVHLIDAIQTVLYRIRGNIAKGAVLREDLTLVPCWVAKGEGCFAHGDTLHAAREALTDKILADKPVEERIAAFVAEHERDGTYSDRDFFDWHHRLTGSCETGRMEFARARGLQNLDGERTVREFIELCEDSYGGDIIRQLKAAYGFGA